MTSAGTTDAAQSRGAEAGAGGAGAGGAGAGGAGAGGAGAGGAGAHGSEAVSWGQFEREAPELAAAVRASFAVRKHCTMATLRADGSPRISGTEVQLDGGELRIGSMAGAVKARDLQRDGRVAVHSPTVDPPEGDEASWPGEAKVSGRAVELPVRADGDALAGAPPGSHAFRIDLLEVVHTRVSAAGDGLVITSWHAGRGVQERVRAG